MKYRHIFSRKLIFIGFLIASIVVAGFVFSNTILASLGFWSTDSLNKGLVGHWPLDGAHLNSTTNRVDDISGYENHGTNSGATLANGVMGESEGAMSFSGDYIEVVGSRIPDQSQFEQEWSVTAWVNIADTGTSQYLTDMANGVELVHSNTDKLLLYLNSGANDYYIYSSQTALLTGQGWKFVTFLFRNSDGYRRIYIDGVNRSGGGPNHTSTPQSLSSTLRIGSGVSGSISDVRIYNRVLSDGGVAVGETAGGEIKRLYESYKPKMSTGPLNKGLVGHWPLRPEGGKTARSCKTILDNHKSHGDGVYKIDPDGPGGTDSFEVYCDMTTDGGGWTLVFDMTSDLDSYDTITADSNWNSCLLNPNPTCSRNWQSKSITGSEYMKKFSGEAEYLVAKFNSEVSWFDLVLKNQDDSTFLYSYFVNDPSTQFEGYGADSSSSGGCQDSALQDVYTWKISNGNSLCGGSSSMGIKSQNLGFCCGWGKDGVVFVRESTSLSDTADTTPNSNHGEVHGAVIRNHGTSFDGSNDYVDMPLGLINGENNVTITSWFKTSDSDGAIISAYNNSSNYSYILKVKSNKLKGGFDIAYNSSDVTSSIDINNNDWHHGVLVWEGDNIILYLDGISVDTENKSGSVLYNLFLHSVGVMGYKIEGIIYPQDVGYLDGQIADTLIYDRALSASEVLDLYNGKHVAGAILDMPLSDKTGFKDISGNGNNGTNNGATIIGQAGSFDGVDDIIETANNVGISGSQARTMSVWAKADSTTQGYYTMITVIGEGTTNKAMFIGTDSTGTKWTFAVWGNNYVTDMNLDTNWHHFVFLYDGTNYIGYIDGIVEVSGTESINTTDSHLFIGRHLTDQTYFSGQISDVRIYNRALSDGGVSVGETAEGEIASLYAKGRSGSSVGITTGSLNKGLVGQWDLKSKNEKVGSEILTNNQFTATADGGTWNTTGTLTLANNWSSENLVSGTDTTSEENTIVHSGGASQKLELSTHASGIRQLGMSGLLTVNRSYRASVWAYTTGSDEYIALGIYDDTAWHDTGYTLLTQNAWKKVSVEFSATNTGNQIRAIFAYPIDTIYIDDFTLKELKTADSTPYGNHGTIYGASYTTDRHGQANKAMSFDGVDEYIDMGDPSEIDFSTNDWTISAWVKQESVDKGTNQGIVSKYINGWTLMLDNGAPRIYIYDGSSNRSVTGTNAADGTWHHVVATTDFDGATTLYVDGVSKGTSSTSLNTLANNNTWKIGQRNGGTTYFKGEIADVRVYNRALSKQEIIQLYESYN